MVPSEQQLIASFSRNYYLWFPTSSSVSDTELDDIIEFSSQICHEQREINLIIDQFLGLIATQMVKNNKEVR